MNNYDNYYPRPLLKRDSFFSLNGSWKLNGYNIEIPFPPESDLSAYDGSLEKMEYRKDFALPESFHKAKDKAILHFGAVDQVCDIYLNGSFLLHHEGGYLPFQSDITSFLKENNTLKVVVKDDLDVFYPYGKQSRNPKGMWYTPVSGIWQSVWIESYPENGIDDLKIETDMHTVDFHIESKADTFQVEFEGYANTFHQKDISIEIKDPHLWSTADPYLYRVTIRTDNDQIESYFALREVKTEGRNGYPCLLLNDQPLFLNGLLDQGYFEKGIYTPEDPRDYETDVLNIKKLGFNCLRKHIKVEAEAFYYYCDLHGILVIQDMVNSGKYSFFKDTVLPTIGLQKLKFPMKDPKRYEFFIRHSKETIDHLKSHPCIIAYTIYNEGWGQQNDGDAYRQLKQCDPKRLFDTASGWFYPEESDFDSFHIYFRNEVLKADNKLLLLSECGGFIRDIAGHKSEKGSRWGYGSTASEEELTEKILQMYEKMYLPSIRNGLCGAIMTQISDVEGEINGIFTYDRKVCKVNHEKILKANQDLQDIYRNLYKN
ncbi:MAG: glycoside hydrolase family 2 [Erysipelotrichaceae bacterium]|nr:glycoside hydrolase family 2 [Erysipelotrichaceae bacterium]